MRLWKCELCKNEIFKNVNIMKITMFKIPMNFWINQGFCDEIGVGPELGLVRLLGHRHTKKRAKEMHCSQYYKREKELK